MTTEKSHNGRTVHPPSGQPTGTTRNRDGHATMDPAVRDIMTNKPGALIRWGNGVFLLILCAMLFICRFVQYPETIDASGRLSLTNPPQAVKATMNGQLEETVCQVDPGDSSYYIALDIPVNASGEIKVGQAVRLQFPSYQKYGAVDGQISSISGTAMDSGYIATVALPNGLRTDLGNLIPLTYGLKANGAITIRNMNLLERFFGGLKKTRR